MPYACLTSSRSLTVSPEATCFAAKPHSYSTFIDSRHLQIVQDSVDIIDVIEAFKIPQFRRIGNDRATCLCPFHDDHNPSLKVDAVRQIFKCFSCGAGGNVFTFVLELAKVRGKKLKFPQVVHLVENHFSGIVSKSATINYPRDCPSVERKLSRLRLANLSAAEFYEQCLKSQSVGGAARAYLQQRGVSPHTVRAFTMGYAPDAYFTPDGRPSQAWGYGSLVDHLRTKGFTAIEIYEAGLATQVRRSWRRSIRNYNPPPHGSNCTQWDNQPLTYSSLIDRFRGRLILPIFDTCGDNILGFGGRILHPNGNSNFKSHPQHKYINSPRTQLFEKRRVLFGAHLAKSALQACVQSGNKMQPVVIVEGYMDAIALWHAEGCQAVSCMGASIGAEQIVEAASLVRGTNSRGMLRSGVYN